MTRHVRIPFLIAVVLALCAAPASAATPAYKDARQPVNKRVADLLSRMTIEEKIGQMTQTERATVDADPTQDHAAATSARSSRAAARRRRRTPLRRGPTWSTATRPRRSTRASASR